jgi:ATP-dependent DNA ligase
MKKNTPSSSRSYMYKTDVRENYCSCKAWKYQRKHNPSRDCKHLIKKRGFALPPSDGYEYTKTKPKFMLLSETVPKKPILNVEDYVFSRKYDGIRAALKTDGELITRGGVVLSDFDMKYKPPFQLDGELCHLQNEGHVDVMKALDKKQYNDLIFRVFDLWPSKNECIPYVDRYNMLFDMHQYWPKTKMELVSHHDFESDSGSTLQDQIKTLVKDCSAQKFEGIVVRLKDGCYISSGKRDNKVIFKVKP